MKNKILILIIAINSTIWINVSCQNADNIVRLGFLSNYGISFIGDNSDLNQYLSDHTYPNIPRFLGSINFFEVESQFKRIILKSYIYANISNSGSSKSSDYKSGLGISGFAAMFGYEIYSNDALSIYPSIGYDLYSARLNLKSPNKNTHFEDFINSSNSLYLDKEFSGIRSELCLRKLFNKNLSFTVCVGYRYKFTENQWVYLDSEIQDGPGLKLNGGYLNFGIQINSTVIEGIKTKITNR